MCSVEPKPSSSASVLRARLPVGRRQQLQKTSAIEGVSLHSSCFLSFAVLVARGDVRSVPQRGEAVENCVYAEKLGKEP